MPLYRRQKLQPNQLVHFLLHVFGNTLKQDIRTFCSSFPPFFNSKKNNHNTFIISTVKFGFYFGHICQVSHTVIRINLATQNKNKSLKHLVHCTQQPSQTCYQASLSALITFPMPSLKKVKSLRILFKHFPQRHTCTHNTQTKKHSTETESINSPILQQKQP